MTCKKFYFNEIIKENLYETISTSLPVINHYLFLHSIIKSQKFQELILTNDKNYLKDPEIDSYKLFFQNNLNKIISVKKNSCPEYMSVPEFLVSNLRDAFPKTSLKLGSNHSGLAFTFRHHFSIFEYICLNGDLCLPCILKPDTTIAQFLLNSLQNNVLISHSPITISLDTKDTIHNERYKIRNCVDQVPEEIILDFSLLLSNEAFEKLQNAVNNPKKKVLDKKLLDWILPKLPAQSAQSFWYRYFIQKICYIYKSLLHKIRILITIIQKSLYNHI